MQDLTSYHLESRAWNVIDKCSAGCVSSVGAERGCGRLWSIVPKHLAAQSKRITLQNIKTLKIYLPNSWNGIWFGSRYLQRNNHWMTLRQNTKRRLILGLCAAPRFAEKVFQKTGNTEQFVQKHRSDHCEALCVRYVNTWKCVHGRVSFPFFLPVQLDKVYFYAQSSSNM